MSFATGLSMVSMPRVFGRTAIGGLVGLLGACAPSNDAPPALGPSTSAPAQPQTPTLDLEGLNEVQQADLQRLSANLDAARSATAESLLSEHALEFAPLSYDPSSAEFLDSIQGSALALNDAELSKLGSNGFVISTRQAFPTFVNGYAAIYSEDLPVYVSADSILEALHSSYDELLKVTEESALIPKVRSILDQAHAALSGYQHSPGAQELDLYLAVARALLSGAAVSPVAGAEAASITQIVQMAQAAEGIVPVELFGETRDEDMSQFVPRGHYTDNEALERYFRAMMWLGRVDFRLIETLPSGDMVLRRPQVNAALLLNELLSDASVAAWRQVDLALQTFVGRSDYMVLSELDQLTADLAGYENAVQATDETVMQAIVDGGYGMQLIASHIMVNDGNVETLPLNRSFALFGQRYVIDSHVFSQVVYDRTEDMRMMPNTLDVAYAALGNDAALPLLRASLEQYPLDYPGNLESARVLSDEHGDDFWSGTLYNLWLGSLRELSPQPSEVAAPSAVGLPQLAGTESWSRRILNTQLGSWAQLRHDTLLYAKQSYSGVPACEYPDAYVDPYPGFYTRLTEYADLGLALTNELGDDLGYAEDRVAAYFHNLKTSMTKLGEMAQNQRDGVAFNDEQLAFINNAVRVDAEDVGCASIDVPNGWLADLYLFRESSIEFDPTIADVHTQPTDEVGNTVGKVLHVGTGYPRLMVATIDTCQGPRAYAGVTFAYHEKVTEQFERLTDEKWAEQVGEASDVEWMGPILAP